MSVATRIDTGPCRVRMRMDGAISGQGCSHSVPNGQKRPSLEDHVRKGTYWSWTPWVNPWEWPLVQRLQDKTKSCCGRVPWQDGEAVGCAECAEECAGQQRQSGIAGWSGGTTWWWTVPQSRFLSFEESSRSGRTAPACLAVPPPRRICPHPRSTVPLAE